ncbi:hypothetical protein WR25_12417 [Diploscapter pachys]|uniref:Galectin domain-containing protein n=1 Tax=Diploscapter pachys TaxID=2018661 RepID=A0A2A2J4X3_9BILA|nr:hypothetical protein WR25_12417 [Diploscapter pachys]
MAIRLWHVLLLGFLCYWTINLAESKAPGIPLNAETLETFEPGAEDTEETEPGIEEQPSESEIGPEPPEGTEPSGPIHHGHGAPGGKPPGHKLGGSAPSFSPGLTLDIPAETLAGVSLHLANGVEISNKNGKWVDGHGVAYKPVLKQKLSIEPGQENPITTMELEWEPDTEGSNTSIEEAQFANSLLLQSLGSQQPEESEPSAPSGELKIPKTPSIPLPDMDEVMKANKENDEETSETDEGGQEPEEEEEEPTGSDTEEAPETSETSDTTEAPSGFPTTPTIPMPPTDEELAREEAQEGDNAGDTELESSTQKAITIEAPGEKKDLPALSWWLKDRDSQPTSSTTWAPETEATTNNWWATSDQTTTPSLAFDAVPVTTKPNIWWTTTKSGNAGTTRQNIWWTTTRAPSANSGTTTRFMWWTTTKATAASSQKGNGQRLVHLQAQPVKQCIELNFLACEQILGQSWRRADAEAYRAQNDYTVSLGKNEYCSVVLHIVNSYTISLGKNEYCSVVLHLIDDYEDALVGNSNDDESTMVGNDDHPASYGELLGNCDYYSPLLANDHTSTVLADDNDKTLLANDHCQTTLADNDNKTLLANDHYQTVLADNHKS